MTLKTDNYQIGLDSVTDSKNYLLDTDVTGALRIRRNSDGSGATVLKVGFDNSVTFPSQPTSAFSCIRVSTANGYGSINTCIRRYTTVALNQGTDITYADSATLGASFTINTAGVYSMYTMDQSGSAMITGISVNTTQPAVSIVSLTNASERIAEATSVAGSGASCSVSAYLAAGSVVRPHTDGATASGVRQQFTITRVA